MKKFVFIMSACSGIVLYSCSGKGGSMSAAAKKNLDNVHAINKAIETGDTSKLADVFAANCIDHSGMPGEVKGADEIKKELAGFHSMATDMKAEVVSEAATDDYSYEWMHWTGTSTMDGMGMKKGQKFDMNAIEVTKHDKDSKATDHWEFTLNSDIAKMMPPQTNMTGTDSTHH